MLYKCYYPNSSDSKKYIVAPNEREAQFRYHGAKLKDQDKYYPGAFQDIRCEPLGHDKVTAFEVRNKYDVMLGRYDTKQRALEYCAKGCKVKKIFLYFLKGEQFPVTLG